MFNVMDVPIQRVTQHFVAPNFNFYDSANVIGFNLTNLLFQERPKSLYVYILMNIPAVDNILGGWGGRYVAKYSVGLEIAPHSTLRITQPPSTDPILFARPSSSGH
jgi:hypothetical protein